MKLNNKNILITGAAAGIGKELTMQLLEKNCNIIALDIDEIKLNELKICTNNNQKLSTYVVDVSSDESLIKFKNDYKLNYQTLDVLINNAGIIQPFINVEKLEMNVINKIMNVNFYGPLKLTKLFLNEMLKKEEAHIVNISSMGGFFPFPGQTIYGASKAALKLFTEGLYSELLDTNVKVTVVFPGAIKTDIAKNSHVEMKESENSNFKMLSAQKAANQIIKGIEKNKFKLYIGNDSKIMNLMYKINDKKAIKMINKKMKQLK